MTRIRATCPVCGEVDLRPADIELEIVRDVLTDVGEGSCYRFSCPTCEDLVTKPADERIARLLTSGGVPVSDGQDTLTHEVAAPTLPPHPEAPPAGPAFTHDDLLDLHQLLDDADWFRDLEALTR